MLKFFAKRIGGLLFTMLVVSFLIFLTFELSSQNVAKTALGQFATKAQLELYNKQHCLTDTFLVRYGAWLGVVPNCHGEVSGLLQGDFGESHLWRTKVNTFIWDRIGNTTILALLAFAIIAPLSVLFGVTAGMREGSFLDRTISVMSTITTSVPEFCSGAILAAIFVVGLSVLPGTAPMESGGGWSIGMQLVLPVATLTIYYMGYVVRMVRASMVEVMTRPYIRTAVLKGMRFRDVITKHALRNAMIAPFTVILLQINYLVTGVVVVEAVFAYPGFGRMMLEAALSQDIAVIEAGALFSVLVAVVTQIVGDFGYMLLNPRIRFS